MIGHRCQDCIWWDNQHPAAREIPVDMGKSRPGFCRKHKPGAMRIGKYYYGVQPVMDGDEFCGEFREEKK